MSSTYIKQRIADEAVRLVDKNPALSRKARTAYKAFKRNYVRAASIGKQAISGRGKSPQNIYHASIQRTGSRWIRSIFSDPRIQRHTGLWTYPQHEYEIAEQHRKFPKYTFVPGLYISYEQYIRIDKPKKHRTFYVTRDPKNAVLSWCKSMRSSHKLTNKSVAYYRKKLSKLNFDDALSSAIKLYSVKISFMKDWCMQARDNEKVMLVKFEDIIRDTLEEIKKILSHCGINIDKNVLKKVINERDKESMRERDKKRRGGGDSDYRNKRTSWKEEFSKDHLSLFREINGNASGIIGYKN